MRFNLIIDNKPVDLFTDESVQLSRQLKDLQDLSTVWTDYTQSFTIPSSPTNDKIFANWFDENAIFSGWNPNIGLDANILIHGLPVFDGRVELKGVKFTDSLPSSYDIIFYGKSKQILDLWGESLLNEIDWSAYDHTANNANVTGSWNQTLIGGDILYPMADYFTGFRYSNSSGINNNIKLPRGIEIDDIRPAIRLTAMIEKAFESIGYTVSGSFLNRSELEDLYVLPMQNAGALYDKTTTDLTFTAKNDLGFSFVTTPIGTTGLKIADFDSVPFNPSGSFDSSTDIYTAQRRGFYAFEFSIENLTIAIGKSLTIGFCVNGALKSSVTYTNGFSGTQTEYFTSNLNAGDAVTIEYISYGSNTAIQILFACANAPFGLKNTIVDMGDAMPQMKIEEFVNGCLKAFNLIALPVNDNEVELHNVYDWYELGTIKDYTEYLDIKEITHEKIPVPKTISLTHKPSNLIANQYYKNISNREFGSISYSPNVDFPNEELKIETIFNVLTPSLMDQVNSSGAKVRTTQLNLPVFLDKDGKAVKQDLTLFYYGGKQTVTDTYYFDGVIQTIFPLMTCFSGYPTSKTNFSNAFGIENSFNGDAPLNTMYLEYWHKYLTRMYSTRSRLVKMKAILPVVEWLNMQLNDTILISGNYYKMQSIQYDMLTEIANLELITYPDVNFLTIDSDEDTIDYGDPTENNQGLTYVRSYTVASGIMNSFNSGGINYVNTMQDINYNQNSVSDLVFQMANVQQTLTFNQYTLWSNTPQLLTPPDTLYHPIPQTEYEQIGFLGNLTYNLATASFTALEGGQYKFIGMASYEQTGNKHLVFAILVNGLETTAYATADSNFHSVQIDTILTLGINDVVTFQYRKIASGSHSINVLRTNFIILKK
jgi:hypothetical protein